MVGVAGPGDSARALGRWLVASAALLHSPHELRIYLLTDASGQAGWEWVRWLPHCRPGPGGSCVAQLGNDAESIGARLAELLAIVAARQRVIHDGYLGVGCGPGIVVVVDGSRRLRSLPGVGQLLGAREGRRSASTSSAWMTGSGCCRPNARRWPCSAGAGCGSSRRWRTRSAASWRTMSIPAGAPGWPGPWRRSGTSAMTGAGRAGRAPSGRLRRFTGSADAGAGRLGRVVGPRPGRSRARDQHQPERTPLCDCDG